MVHRIIIVVICFLLWNTSSKAQVIGQLQKIVASDRSVFSNFGTSVAISGDYAVVGAYNEDFDSNGGNYMNNAGAAYVFERDTSGVWVQSQKIVPSDRTGADFFGYSTAIDGNIMLVSAHKEEHDVNGLNQLAQSGSVYVFERNANGIWLETQKLTATMRKAGAHFGWDVALSGDYAVIGTYGEHTDLNGMNALNLAGSACIFERDANGNWNQVQKIIASDRMSGDFFGLNVAIDGNYVIISADKDDDNIISGVNKGCAYIFERNTAGSWIEVQKLTASDKNIYDCFGASVSIYDNYAFIGADEEDEDEFGGNTIQSAGSVYIFERNVSGVWIEIQKIVASDRAFGDSFGKTIFASGDNLLVGSQHNKLDSNGLNSMYSSGAVYLFQKDQISGAWIENRKIVASDREPYDIFGNDIAIDMNSIIVAAMDEDEDENGLNTISNSGSAYITSIPCVSTPNAGTNDTVILCMNDFPINLFLLVTPADADGYWYPPLASGSGIFNPAIDSEGDYHYIINRPPCIDDSSMVSIRFEVCDTIFVEDIDSIVIPNVFSPNQDGRNELFYLKGRLASPFVTMKIFNRWGVLLFESNLQRKGWDGTTSTGSRVPEGTYYYIITTEDEVYKGTVSLLR